MLKAAYCRYLLDFKEAGGTSRGVLTQKESWLIRIWDSDSPAHSGWGECALFRGLSADDRPHYEDKLREICNRIHELDVAELTDWSSIRFGVETALLDWQNGGNHILYPSAFTQGECSIEINGLIWMGSRAEMAERIAAKMAAGFHCLKLKIGAIDFDAELSLIQAIRERFSPDEIELRVDANGAFSPQEAPKRLEQLARYAIHSIEQPIRAGQRQEMQRLCRDTPIPIALDEELIGVVSESQKRQLITDIRPQYIILKPALVGGFAGAQEWIETANQVGCGWWITSALESNIGLNAIAQWTYTLQNPMPQGLGTGQLYHNNFESPLRQIGSTLTYDPTQRWRLPHQLCR